MFHTNNHIATAYIWNLGKSFSNPKLNLYFIVGWIIDLIGICEDLEAQTFPAFVSSYEVFPTPSYTKPYKQLNL